MAKGSHLGFSWAKFAPKKKKPAKGKKGGKGNAWAAYVGRGKR